MRRSMRGTSVAIWENQGLTDCMIDPERNDGRPPADAEGVDVFRR